MRKSIITILGVILMTLFIGIALADPWETYKNTAYSRSDVVIGPTFDFTTSATGTTTFPNGATIPSGKDLIVGGNVSITGILSYGTNISEGKISESIWIDDELQVTNTSALNETTATNVTASATVQAEHFKSTDDAYVVDDLVVDGGARVDEALTANSISINTTGTYTGIQTFTVAPVFNAGILIPTGDTLNTVDADGVKSGGVIVPQEMIINVPITTSEPDQTVFIADDAWQITKIEEVHATAQNTVYPNTGSVTVTKCTGTQAAASGSVLHNTSMYLNNTVETIQTPTLNAAIGALNLADGNRLAINVNGTMTTFANGLITIHMKRI